MWIHSMVKSWPLYPRYYFFAVHRNIIRYFHFGSMDHGSVLVKFQAEGKIFEITRTIHLNSERSEQFLVTECFLNLLGFRNMQEKLKMTIFPYFIYWKYPYVGCGWLKKIQISLRNIKQCLLKLWKNILFCTYYGYKHISSTVPDFHLFFFEREISEICKVI